MNCPKCESDNTYQEGNKAGEFWKCENCNIFFNNNGTQLECHKIVCPQCDGEGKTTNPAIDGNGISPDEFYEDPDFEEGYFSGRYDIRCILCNGSNVINEFVEDWNNPAFVALVEDREEEIQYQATCAAERTMGA